VGPVRLGWLLPPLTTLLTMLPPATTPGPCGTPPLRGMGTDDRPLPLAATASLYRMYADAASPPAVRASLVPDGGTTADPPADVTLGPLMSSPPPGGGAVIIVPVAGSIMGIMPGGKPYPPPIPPPGLP